MPLATGYFNSAEINLRPMSGELYEGKAAVQSEPQF